MAHKPKRVGFVLDMTPLVDVAFLLLTFFMFTAKFKSDAENEQKFDIKRPVAAADTAKLPDAGTGIVKIGIDDKTGDTMMFYAVTDETKRESVFKDVPGVSAEDAATRAQVEVPDTTALARLILQSRIADNKMKFIVDADKRITFRKIDQVMNTLRGQGATIFNFVTVSAADQAPTAGAAPQ